MDKYKQLIVIFSDTLKKSKDYHIAYLHGIGYASVIGVYQKGIEKELFAATIRRRASGLEKRKFSISSHLTRKSEKFR